MKSFTHLIFFALFFSPLTGYGQYASVDFDSTYKITFSANKLQVNGQNPSNITLHNQSKIVLDISNSGLAGLDLFISTTPDYPFSYTFPQMTKAVVKSGTDGTTGAKITIDILAAKEATGNEFHPIFYLCSKQKVGAFNKLYVFNKPTNQDYIFTNNTTYIKQILPKTIVSNYSNQIGNFNYNIGPVFSYSPFLIIDDLNNDKVDDFILNTNNAFFQGKFFNTGGMAVPLYKYLTKNNDNTFSIKNDNEDMSFPDSKPKALFHNVNRASIIDLNNDGKKEIIGWGEGYHQSPDPLLPEFAKLTGLKENIDFKGDENTSFNKLMYLKKLTFYENVNGKLVDKRNLVPDGIPLSASIFGSAGDLEKDGDNDMIVISEGVWTLVNNNYQFTLKKILNSDNGDFMKEGFFRRISTTIPYLIDINQDGYGDLIFSLEKMTGDPKPNRIVYALNNKNQGFDFEALKDFIPYNDSSSKDNYLNYVLSDVYADDINNNGTQEVVFCFAKEFSSVAMETPYPSQQFYRIVEIEKSGNIKDLTSSYFEGTSSNIKVSSKNGGNFFLKNIDKDPELEIIPYFNTYDPAYYSFFPKEGWYGYWNNYTGFQYFDLIDSKYKIRKLGNILGVSDDNSPGKNNAVKTYETYANGPYFLHDFDKDGNIEILITGNNADQLLQPTADFQFISKSIDVKENLALNTDIDSITVSTPISLANFTFSLLEENNYIGLKNNKFFIKGAIDFETIPNKKITLPIKVTNTKYNTFTIMERSFNITDVVEVVILANQVEEETKIAPNPFSNLLNVSFPSTFGKTAQLKIMDMTGNILFRKSSVTNGDKIDVSSMASGNYILHLESNDNSNTKAIKISKVQ